MKITFLRYVFVLITVGTILILADSGWSAAQSDPVPSIVESEPSPPDEPPTPALNESPASDEDLGYQALVQGPVHEAFAAPVDTDHTDGMRIFDQPPPESIDEQPPETGSEVEGMKWIPGYWSWSDEVSDYVWVSGLWRKIPRGRTWAAGYWSETQSGHHRWTSGYWAGGETPAGTANYLPVPPKSIDNGPSTPPPGEDHFWVPGNWEYVEGDYRWRSGYWSLSQGDWVWQPACYVYSPQGYLSVDGYWDYLPPDRGQLYAPVTFYDPVYLQPNYVYRPRYPLANTASLLLSLFVRPGYSHYYYGNFYGSSYASLGYRPWYDVGFGSGYVTPWFNNYDRLYRRSGIDFVGSMRRYENHSHADWKQPQYASGKRSIAVDAQQISTAARSSERSGRSMDAFIRSDVGRVAINPSGKLSQGNSGRNLAFPSSGISRSAGLSSSQDGFRNLAPNSNFRGDNGRSNSLPSNGSNKFSKSVGRGDLSSGSPMSFGSNQFSRSSDARSIGPSPSFQGGPTSSSNFRSLGSSPSFQGGPSSSSNFRSLGSSSSIQRGPSSSFNRGSSSLPSFQRGGSSSFSGGRGSLGFSGRSGSSGKSNSGGGGSQGRGKGKK